MMSGPVLAIDVGGTKLAAAVVEPDGTIRARGWVATPPSDSAQVVTGALRDLVRQVTDEAPADRLTAVGIGSAGPLDPAAGTVSPVNIPAWRGFGIVDALRSMVPGRPAVLAGDGHCMALGEYWRGHRPAGRATRALLGMVVSTGVGGGLVIDGHVHSGPTGNAGHIGHIVVDLHGPPCPCGGRGCVEALASGPAMVRWARQHGWSPGEAIGFPPNPRRAGSVRTPERPALDARVSADARSLAADARGGHPVARAAFARSGSALAAAIVSAAALIDLDDVVVGGGVAQAGDLLFDPLRDSVADLAGLAFVRRVRIHPSPLGNDAGLLGAAALALDAAGGD
jgi:glucokinase